MKRIKLQPRKNFIDRAAEIGFAYAIIDGKNYWDESAAYIFSMREIEDELESPSKELAALCLNVVSHIIENEQLLQKLHIPEYAWQMIADSWKKNEPSLYGRFDFSYDGKTPAKLLEYNADTPTSLFESAVVQWFWLRDMIENGSLPVNADQYIASAR